MVENMERLFKGDIVRGSRTCSVATRNFDVACLVFFFFVCVCVCKQILLNCTFFFIRLPEPTQTGC